MNVSIKKLYIDLDLLNILIFPDFFYHLMRSIVSLNVFASDSNSEIIKHLTAEKLKSYRLPFPPLDEQIHIANFLDQENSKINELLKITQSSIETLENYRQALITAAVTGKIDVREAVEL